MRFGFRISRSLWVSLPWWLAPLILFVLLGELIFALVMLMILGVVAVVSYPFRDQRKRPAHPEG